MGYLAIVVTITATSIQIGKDVVSILPPPEAEDKVVIEQSNDSDQVNPSNSESSETIET